MGCLFSSYSNAPDKSIEDLKKPIRDEYENYEQLQKGLVKAGLESSDLILGIDYTQSNYDTGMRTNGGRCLHEREHGRPNQYQSVLTAIYKTLFRYDDDKKVPIYGFGDLITKNKYVFPIGIGNNLENIMELYENITSQFNTKSKLDPAPRYMSGPTSFVPLINEALRIIKNNWTYHILVIITDGQIVDEKETAELIGEASNYPLSIITIGVGDGPFTAMERFDDKLTNRRFDNFQFVNYEKYINKNDNGLSFALNAMMEIPEQYTAIRKLGLLTPKYQPVNSQPTAPPPFVYIPPTQTSTQ